jgi:hypothetical protein
MNNEEARVIGYCAECGHSIYDDNEDVYVDEDGNYFDGADCVMDFYKIHKLEF